MLICATRQRDPEEHCLTVVIKNDTFTVNGVYIFIKYIDHRLKANDGS